MPGEYEFLYLIGEKSSPVVDSERPTSCPAPCNRATYKVPMIPAPSTSILIQHLAHHHYPLFSVTNAEVAGRKAGSLFVAQWPKANPPKPARHPSCPCRSSS